MISTGGGSSAVAASAHAACARFRGTDPLITGRPRRKLAAEIGFEDLGVGIPEARWMRAMTFERLVRDRAFASRVTTSAVGALGLDRPTSVVTIDVRVDAEKTASALSAAHDRAVRKGEATLIHQPALPFPGFEGKDATDVKPDYVVVAPTAGDGSGSWLIVGDAKDYERVRSRIDDGRMLKGFLQVALGAEAFEAWSRVPDDMTVHTHGILAVPRNAFLQPMAIVEDLHDHREEVRMRVAERRAEAQAAQLEEDAVLADYVAHLTATFDPSSCTTCNMFSFCREELRGSADPEDLLVEIGIDPSMRTHVRPLIADPGAHVSAPESIVAMVRATLAGTAVHTGQRRIDAAGLPGTINIVLAKSDAAALGVHGIGIQRVSESGRGRWKFETFANPQSPETRRNVMRHLGVAIEDAMRDQRKANPDGPSPIHLVVPDSATADLLTSIADNLAGVELSRLRWERDLDQHRPALTWDGEPAEVPRPLRETARTAVSFLLEEDRARALSVRCPIIDLRTVLSRHIIAGGPAVNALRLDYVVEWAASSKPIDHRAYGDSIEQNEYTPGARLTKTRSDALHQALAGVAPRGRAHGVDPDPALHDRLTREELAYKAEVLDVALDALQPLEVSELRDAYRAVEGDAQAVWRRRLSLNASDLVRFGRTYRRWRNSLVNVIEADAKCHDQLLALTNPSSAAEMATDAGTRHLAHATVLSVEPLEIKIDSRRIVADSKIVLLHINGEPCVEGVGASVTLTSGAFTIEGVSIGALSRDGIDEARPEREFRWMPKVAPHLALGDELVVADVGWFASAPWGKRLNLARPKADEYGAPKIDCTRDSYRQDPEAHKWCCKSHVANESEFSDQLAERRARGELNPEVWPPVRDLDGFEVSPGGLPEGDATRTPSAQPPVDVTLDDVE
ncbi:hypothetical protein [Microbacterium sp. C7(2022)]|uniref:hypothetical protein n=1 Tax=Microbacterium sp. C7(2022) TaxID=2992759 RepID=UPI00237B406D|nr:hypothetical protein [Microbacterium sp. C7(2022)]MDE0547434.1 hypothetical protein [Microbacterium sp. C7(2022)]